ncbi:MAG: GNAT family N-acetyltransferase [Clostridiaceae bacterium]|nr:GNAT family N-acetyltransferase [Clostridiaceae bacterium]
MIIDYKNDIYFDPRLGEIYATLEGGRFHEFDFKNDAGSIRHQFIIRPIELAAVTAGKTDPAPQLFYDLTTPYGYGGPLIMEVKPGRKQELLDGFAEAFAGFCKEENIVSEFVRFHILAGNAEDFSSMYETELFNHTVGINLADYDDPFQDEFAKSARKVVRRCLRDGMTWEIEENPDTLEDFAEIYYQTMDRNEAADRYYFDADYFAAFIETMPEAVLKCRVLYEDKTIAMGFFLRSADVLHIHLSGTLSEYLHLSPAYVLRYGLTQWGREQGYKLIHTGGGISGDPEDSLYLFKKRFSRNTEFDFYIGRKVWNEEVYHELVELSGTAESGFFPQYRAEM